MKTVKVGQMPGRLEEYSFEDNTSIAQAIEVAGLNASGFEVRVGGTVITDLNTVVTNGSTILLVKQIKGNAPITVKVGQMPGRLNEFVVEANTSVAEVLNMAGLNPSGFEIRIAGAVVNADALVTTDGATILLVKQIKGN